MQIFWCLLWALNFCSLDSIGQTISPMLVKYGAVGRRNKVGPQTACPGLLESCQELSCNEHGKPGAVLSRNPVGLCIQVKSHPDLPRSHPPCLFWNRLLSAAELPAALPQFPQTIRFCSRKVCAKPI
jgi:hypothetical protein